MSDIIRIGKESIKVDGDSGEFIEIGDSPITKFFSHVVELEENITVSDFMNHIRAHSELIDSCFCSYIDNESIIQYCDLSNESTEDKYPIDIVELFWASDLIEDEYCLFGTFHGMVLDKDKYNFIEANGINSFPLDLIPLNRWKHCKLVINDFIRASSVDEEEQSHVLKLRNRWTLFELLEYFLMELMCHGSVENQVAEIKKSEAEQEVYSTFRVDPNFADKLSKEEIEAFIEEIEEHIGFIDGAIQDAVDNDDYETAAQYKKEGEELSIELDKMKEKLSAL